MNQIARAPSDLLWGVCIRLFFSLDSLGERIKALTWGDIPMFLLGGVISGIMNLVFFFAILIIFTEMFGLSFNQDYPPKLAFMGFIICNTVIGAFSFTINHRHICLKISKGQVYLSSLIPLVLMSVIVLFICWTGGAENVGHPFVWIAMVGLGVLLPTCLAHTCAT
ncbi:hypothetical protein KKG41_06620 [Patescibacteria group bacterium]|nr:hypothetical protein [Patescibacteria group bacterium]MBU1890670.1 hypothetical protein [Patescibacteria group bacterium]